MKWFIKIKTLDELRTTYRKLAMQHHPDKGGKLSDKQEINNEYASLSRILIDGNIDFSEGRKTYETQASEEIKRKIDEIISIEGLIIEIIGSWIWLTGNTKPVKEQLKEAKFRFSSNKIAWYWHYGDYRKGNGSVNSMDEIRNMWGAETVNNINTSSRSLN